MPYCSHCGNEISELAVACPKCGHPNDARKAGLSIQVPTEQGPVAVGAYASFGSRFLALLLDGLILSGAGFFLGPFGGGVGFLYHWLMIAFNRGQTVGKMVLGIRITKPDGGLVDVGGAAVRAAMSIVSGLAIGIGYLWAAWDPENRTWHDIVADTRAYRVS